MNKRLLAFLHKRGLKADATDSEAWEFYRSLQGLDASLANALNYGEADEAARTNSDIMIRALGHNPAEPWNLLPADDNGGQQRQTGGANTPVTLQTGEQLRGTDGASASGAVDIEQYRMQGITRENERVRTINELAGYAGCSMDFVRTLTADPRITLEDARRRIREDFQSRTRAEDVAVDLPGASGFGAPAQHSRNSQTDFNAMALQSALMLRAGIDDPAAINIRADNRSEEVVFGQRSNPSDEALRARDRGYELRQLPVAVFIQRALALDGIRVEPTVSDIAHAFKTRGAAMSTTSLVNIFTQTFGARLMRGWTEVGDTTEGWVDVEEAPNYLPQEVVSVGVNGEGLAHLPRGAEAEDITLSDSNDYTKVVRYARKAIFDETDIINDNFGVITNRVPLILGQIARRLRPDLVYAILLANPTMADGVALFHSTHGNLLASSGAFSETTLEAAWTAMTTRRLNGVSVNITPTHVVHPVAIGMTVEKVLNPIGTVVVAGTTDVSALSTPVMARKGLRSAGDARLDNGVIDPKTGTTYAGDANDWYLVAAGNDSPAPIMVTYLAGTRRSPRFRSGTLDRGQFGIWFDVQHNIGAKAVHYETIRKMVQ